MKTELRTKAKNDFEKKKFSKLINSFVFGTTMENLRNHRGIKNVTTDKRRNNLASECKCNYYTTKHLSEKLLAIEMNKADLKMNKPVYLVLSSIGMTM